MNRDKKIISASITGIIANVFLAVFKAFVGLLSNSVAVILDAINNLSDAMSSLITIIGTKLAAKEPDKKHPLGYGRIEYLSATVIAVIVLYAGVTSLIESVKKLIHPVNPDYSTATLIILCVAVAVKILLGLYVKKVGKEVDSDALIASGSDALNDSVISFSTVVAAVIFMIWKVRLEAILGIVISAVIIRSGFEMLSDTISEILGERVDSNISKNVKKTITSFDNVHGAYDLIIHNYGPDRLIGSVHIEVPDTLTVSELDNLEREISKKVLLENHVIMTGISIYSDNTKNETARAMKEEIMKIVKEFPDALQMHGFFLDEEQKTAKFDLIIDFDSKKRHETFCAIRQKVQEKYPEYTIQATEDYDISD